MLEAAVHKEGVFSLCRVLHVDLGFNTAVLCIVLLDETCNSLLTILLPTSLEASNLPQAVFMGCKKKPKHQFITHSLPCFEGKNHNRLCFAWGLWQNQDWIHSMWNAQGLFQHKASHKTQDTAGLISTAERKRIVSCRCHWQNFLSVAAGEYSR